MTALACASGSKTIADTTTMRSTLSLIRREFTAYFLSPIAYVVLTVFLLGTGFLYWQTYNGLTDVGPKHSTRRPSGSRLTASTVADKTCGVIQSSWVAASVCSPRSAAMAVAVTSINVMGLAN